MLRARSMEEAQSKGVAPPLRPASATMLQLEKYCESACARSRQLKIAINVCGFTVSAVCSPAGGDSNDRMHGCSPHANGDDSLETLATA